MKATYRIAKNELKALFYSPIAWLLLVVFMVEFGLVYTNAIAGAKTTMEVGDPNLLKRFFFNMTQRILGNQGLFSEVLDKIYLYLPLLTMGLMSRETGSGTIKLLYSSPIKVRQIVIGKFVAMMLFSLLLVGLLSIFVVCGTFNIAHTDIGPLLAGLLGVYLMLCVYSAIGLFMSCLTTYQVVAAISTLVMLAVLNYVGRIWQDIDFIRDLTYFLSISGRAGHLLRGLLSTKDILYFVLISGMFLALSIYKLRGERETKPGFIRFAGYTGIVAATVLTGYIFSRPGLIGYVDTTTTKSQTLAVKGQELLKSMNDGPLEITSYINLLDQYYQLGKPENRNIDLDRWEPFQRFKSDIRLNYVYFYDSTDGRMLDQHFDSLGQMAEKTAKAFRTDLSRFKTPEEIRKEIDLRPEGNHYVMQLKYKGRTTFLRLFQDQIVYPSDREILSAIKRLTTTPPKIVFVTGELERNITQIGDRMYKMLFNERQGRFALINQGFDVESISLREQDIPAGIAALVIADPKQPFDSASVRKIQRYIAGGGNLLIAGEPGRQDIVNPLLRTLGVQMMDGLLVEKSADYAPDLVTGELAAGGQALSPALRAAATDNENVSLAGAAALSFDPSGPFQVQPLIVTNEKSTWNKKKKFNPEMIEEMEGPYNSPETQAPNATVSVAAVAPAGAENRKQQPVGPSRPRSGISIKDTRQSPDAVVMTNVIPEGKPPKVSNPMAPKSNSAGIATGNSTQPGPQQVEGGAAFRKLIDSLKAARASGSLTTGTASSGGSATLSAGATTVPAGSIGTLQANTTIVKPMAVGTISATTPKTGQSDSSVALLKVNSQPAKIKVIRLSGSSLPKPAITPVHTQAARTSETGGTKEYPVNLNYSPAEGDIRGTLPVALGLTRTINGKQQRIIVAGDADFLSNGELSRHNFRSANFIFGTSIFTWFANNEFPVDVTRPHPADDKITVSEGGITAEKIVFLGILPGLTLLLAAVILIRRKRK